MFTPLNQIEGVASWRPGRELLTLREPRAVMPLHGVMGHPTRGAVALFAAELMDRTLCEPQPDGPLFDFIAGFVSQLNDLSVPVANIHLCFMVGLCRHLGVLPDAEQYAPGRLFDIKEGVFRPTAPLHSMWLNEQESWAVALLLRIDWHNQSLYRYSRQQRRRLLKGMIDYMTVHAADLSGMKSPAVLADIFA